MLDEHDPHQHPAPSSCDHGYPIIGRITEFHLADRVMAVLLIPRPDDNGDGMAEIAGADDVDPAEVIPILEQLTEHLRRRHGADLN